MGSKKGKWNIKSVSYFPNLQVLLSDFYVMVLFSINALARCLVQEFPWFSIKCDVFTNESTSGNALYKRYQLVHNSP
jgi:hypothetical protein